MEASKAVALRFEHVNVQRGGLQVLEDVNASVPRGSCTAIVGPNGAGKTTLLKALLGELPHQGGILFPDCPPGQGLRVGYVPQKLDFDRGLPLTVAEFLTLGFQKRPLWFGVARQWRRRAEELLEAVQAQDLVKRRLGALSGGELQRVLLALALLQDPELLLLDEPEAGVDFHGGFVFCELLESLRRDRHFTQLMVSHDLSLVTHHATHVICLNRRVLAEGPPRETLLPATLSATFGLHMGLVNLHSMPCGQAGCTAACCCPQNHA